MTDPRAAAAARLAEILEQENAALAALDLPLAAGLLAEKHEAARQFIAAQQAGPAGNEPGTQRLHDLAERNRRLLERAINVQGSVIGVVAAALPKAAAPGRYAATGAPLRSPQSVAFALLARA